MTARATRARKPRVAAKSAKSTQPANPDDRLFSSDPPSMAEPLLREMLKDPMLLRLMSSDGIEPKQLTTLLDDTRSRLNS